MYGIEIENIASKKSNEEIYYALLEFTKDVMQKRGRIEGKKKIYYISAEFLIGKLLSNNLINLGLYDQVAEALAKKRLNQNHLLVMEVLDVLQHVSLTLLLHLGLQVMV